MSSSISTMVLVAGIALSVLMGIVQLVWALRRVARHSKDSLTDKARCYHCGYVVEGLDIPRCPECGRARGFDCTFDDLGLDEEKVREHIKQQQQELEANEGKA